MRQIVHGVTSADASQAQFEQLVRLLKLAQASPSEAEQVVDEIEKTTPFAQLAEFLRKHPSDRTIALIGLILSILPYILPLAGIDSSQSPAPIVKVEKLSPQQEDDLARKIADDLEKKDNQAPVAGLRKIGRNEPCPCGSHVKYKKCCGDPVKR